MQREVEMDTQKFNSPDDGMKSFKINSKNTFSENDYSLNASYNQYEIQQKFDSNKSEKLNEFKERLKQFEKIDTLEEAIQLAQKILPVRNEITRFNVGDSKCTIINRKNNFRISLDTAEEFISYDFV